MFEGDGRVEEYVGGYDDWERYRRAIGAPTSLAAAIARPRDEPAPADGDRQDRCTRRRQRAPAPAATARRPASPAAARAKLSFKEQRELAALPGRIEALEAERDALRARTAAPEFYKETAEAIRVALARLEAIDPELTAAYDRWHALDARAIAHCLDWPLCG